MAMTGKERAALRAEAHALRATVHVGQHGFTPALIASLDDALRTHELVKVQLNKTVDVEPKDAARELAAETGAEVIQVIGKTTTLYRYNSKLERKPGAAPPWKA